MKIPDTLSFKWLKDSYGSGDVTPHDVAMEVVERSKRYREKNIWITAPDFQLMEQYINRLPNEPNSLPLWGIPFAIKDNIDLVDTPTTAACPEYSYMPKESATVVKKLVDAGAIPVGKTNMDQFATGLVGTRSPYGEVHNAFDSDLISGGSSSGSAVAVALGMAAFSLGTDTAGSGRVPALLNGLVGYKPAPGAWSTKGVVPACASLDCVSVFACSLEDAELVNEYARGFDEGCCWSRNIPLGGHSLPKKICIAKDGISFFGDYADVYEYKWKRAIERLKQTKIPIEYIDYDIFSKAASILYDGPWVAERWCDLGAFVEKHPGVVFPVTEKVLRTGARDDLTATSVFKAMHELQEYKMEAESMLKDAVLIMPTAGGTFSREQVRKSPVVTNSKMGLYTNHCNLLDLAAVAIPEKFGDMEIPFGITIFAPHNAENRVLGMAEAYYK